MTKNIISLLVLLMSFGLATTTKADTTSVAPLSSTPPLHQETVTLDIPEIPCTKCPTLEQALEKVPGVISIKAVVEPKMVVITFDTDKTTIVPIIDALSKAGYSSRVLEEKKSE